MAPPPSLVSPLSIGPKRHDRITIATSMTRIFIIVSIVFEILIAPSHQAPTNTPPIVQLNVALTGGNLLVVREDIQVYSMLALLRVEDADEGQAGHVTCRSESPYVKLDEINLNLYQIQLNNQLDREMIDKVDLIFLCTDKGSPPLSTQANFSLQITDINDNAPSFTQGLYHFTIRENIEPTVELGAVRAVDEDLDENGMISYYLENENGEFPEGFEIDEKTGVITCTSTFDREEKPRIMLHVYALDHGADPQHGEAEVLVEILDVNDNKPVILSKNFSIYEGMKPMSRVGTLKAIDHDIDLNGEVEFELVTGEDGLFIPPFIVDPDGYILAAVPLDRERRDQYVIRVSATDLGAPSLSTAEDITITVVDINDNRPKIIAPKELTGGEDFSAGDTEDISVSNNNGSNSVIIVDWESPEDDKVVLKVVASDEDANVNGRVFYSIESINAEPFDEVDSLFQIDRDTGDVSLRRFVRREDDPVQVLSFLVYDGGFPPLNATASLNVTLDIDFEALTPPSPTDPPGMSQRDGPGGSACGTVSLGLAQCLVYACGLIFVWFSSL